MATALVWDLIAHDGASAAFTKAGASAERAGAQAEASQKRIGGLSKLLGVGFVTAVAGGAMIKMAGDFQQSTNVLVTAAGETAGNLKLVRSGILDIAQSTGTSWKEVTDGMYVLEKAGYRGADALKVERAAAQGAREEGASLATVTNAVTSMMASYHLKASDAVTVTNELKTAAGESKTTMELFAGSLSTVLPIASANKISFADVAGSLATMTQHGTSADQATQELTNTIRNLAAPNAVAIKMMDKFGISSNDVQMKLGDGPGGRGLTGTLNYLSQTVLSKMGPAGTVLLNTFNQSKQAGADLTVMLNNMAPATRTLAEQYQAGTIKVTDYNKGIKALTPDQYNLGREFRTSEDKYRGYQSALRTGLSQNKTYTSAMKDMTGGANGLNTALQTTGESLAGTNERVKRIADSAKIAGTNVSGWDSTQKLFNVKMDMFKQSVEVAGINLGTKLLPPLSSLAGWMAQHTTEVEVFVGALVGIKLAVGGIQLAQETSAAVSATYRAAQKLIGSTAVTTASELDIETAATVKVGSAAAISAGELDAQALAARGVGTAAATSAGGTGLLAGGFKGVGIAAVTGALAVSANRMALARQEDQVGLSLHKQQQLFFAYINLGHSSKEAEAAIKDHTIAQKVAAGQAAKTQGAVADEAHQVNTFNNLLNKTPRNVNANITLSGAGAAISALQSFASEAYAAQAAAQVVGSVVINPQHHAAGGYLTPGWSVVGEQGPEMIHTGGGGRVYSASDTNRMSGGQGMTVHIHVTQPLASSSQIAQAVIPALRMAYKNGAMRP